MRAGRGGATVALRDLRLLAAGFDSPGANSGDVIGPDPDLEGARAFFAPRHVQWGLRVPPELPWPHGRRLMHQRLMGLPAAAFRPAPEPPGVTLRRARPPDLEDVVRVDAEAFGTDPAGATWFESLLDAARAEVVVAEGGGEPVGTAYTLLSDGAAGPALYLAGVAVLPTARRRGVGAAMSSWLLERGFAAGARLAHLHPDTVDAARLYARLGFAEVPGLDVYVDL